MGFGSVVAVLVTCLMGLASCQMDCAFPTSSDAKSVISLILLTGDNPTTPTINVLEFQPLCLAVSVERDRYRFFSGLVRYTCTGNSNCPTGTELEEAVEQIESGCNNVNGVWTNRVGGSTEFIRTTEPESTFVTNTREDCVICLSPALAATPAFNLTTDSVTHCVACVSCSEGVGQNSCTSLTECCNVYVDDMCDTGCPDDGIYTIDPDSFVCLITCPDLGSNVDNGGVQYSSNAVEEGRYSDGTTATVSCTEGYSGGGVVTCGSSGDWSSPSLPTCAIVDCGSPPDLENGKLVMAPTSTTFGTTVTYECNEDENYYFPDGTEDTRMCNASGSWSNPDIECKLTNKPCEPACQNGGSCDTLTGECMCLPDLMGLQCELCEIPDCKDCLVVDGKATCQQCTDNFEKDETKNDQCKEITGGGDDKSLCIICIVIPIAIVLAIILAVVIAIAVFIYYRWKNAPSTSLKEKDAEGINGVARDNPLYLDPTTVAEEVEE